MATICIRNTTAALVTWAGQEIAAGATFTIPVTQQLAFANDSGVLSTIGNASAIINDGTNDYTDVATAIHYLQSGSPPTQKDSDNAILSRVKQAPTGYTYLLKAFDFTTATPGSLSNNDASGTDMGDITISYKDASGNAITDMTQVAANAAQTIVDFEPSHDYYLIGGAAKVTATPSSDLRMWIVMAPDVPAAAGGSVGLVCNVNFKFVTPDDKIEADGRAAKQLTYNATYHTSKMRFIFKHQVNTAYPLGIFIEYYRG